MSLSPFYQRLVSHSCLRSLLLSLEIPRQLFTPVLTQAAGLSSPADDGRTFPEPACILSDRSVFQAEHLCTGVCQLTGTGDRDGPACVRPQQEVGGLLREHHFSHRIP